MGTKRLGSERSPLTQTLQQKLFFSERRNQHSEADRGRKQDEGGVKLFRELCNWLED